MVESPTPLLGSLGPGRASKQRVHHVRYTTTALWATTTTPWWSPPVALLLHTLQVLVASSSGR